MKTFRQNSRHILGGMHSQINAAIFQRCFDLFGKQPLATNLRQRAILNTISGSGHGHDFDRIFIEAMRGNQTGARFIGLRERKLAAPCTDLQAANLQGCCLHIAPSMIPGFREILCKVMRQAGSNRKCAFLE